MLGLRGRVSCLSPGLKTRRASCSSGQCGGSGACVGMLKAVFQVLAYQQRVERERSVVLDEW